MNSQQENKGGLCDTAPLIRLGAENAAIMSIITKINRLDHNDLSRINNHKQFKNKENEKFCRNQNRNQSKRSPTRHTNKDESRMG